mmetsp:Transcript_26496/g.60359  ORF Transcript_26496/g.60359 Transcript_26496/m.60359 type:complete len:201 (+) Transcript_26496:941-1543(+)
MSLQPDLLEQILSSLVQSSFLSSCCLFCLLHGLVLLLQLRHAHTCNGDGVLIDFVFRQILHVISDPRLLHPLLQLLNPVHPAPLPHSVRFRLVLPLPFLLPTILHETVEVASCDVQELPLPVVFLLSLLGSNLHWYVTPPQLLLLLLHVLLQSSLEANDIFVIFIFVLSDCLHSPLFNNLVRSLRSARPKSLHALLLKQN